MSGGRLRAIWRRVLIEIRRDRPSLALLFVAPVVLTGLLAFIIRGGQATPVNAVIVNESGPAGAAIAGALQGALTSGGGTVTMTTDEAAARAAVDSGSAAIAVVIPPASGSAASGPLAITLVTKGVDVTADASQVAGLQKGLLTAIGSTVAAAGGRVPTFTHQTLYGSPTADTVDNLAPAIVGFFAYFFVYILTGVSFLRERTGGTLERLLATPVARGEIVVGYALGFGCFAMLQVAVLLTWALANVSVPALGPLPAFSLGLAIPSAGSPVFAFLVVLLLALGAVSLGIFLSTFARTELQIIQFIPLVIVPQAFLSGVLFPTSSLPSVLQPLSNLMPLTWAVDGLRQVFVRGADAGSGALQLDLLVLAGFAVFFAAIAARTIRREVA